jgi:hypothetical protein
MSLQGTSLANTKTMARKDTPRPSFRSGVLKWVSRLSWAPLAAALLVYPSLARNAHVVDGPDTTCYGAPLAWNCDSLASSLAKEVYVVPLLADLAIITGLAMFIVLLLRIALRARVRPLYLGFLGAIWCWGILSAIYLAGWFSIIDTFVEANLPADVYASFDPPGIGQGF